MSKNILIYLFGACTASSIWCYFTGVINPSVPAVVAVPFAVFSVSVWFGTLFGLITETLNTLDKDK